MKFNNVWNTKAETISLLYQNQNKLGFKVPLTFFFKKKDFKINKEKILKKVFTKFKNKKIIIRSSSKNEDNQNLSNAGKFKSYSNLHVEKDDIQKYIELVILDFKDSNDQILIQEYIDKPTFAGVIFSRDINNNSPYITLNIDYSGRTDLITSGQYNPSMETLIFYKEFLKYKVPTKFKKLLFTLIKLENFFDNDRLDIEFCVKKNDIYIFQCRPLKKIPSNKISDTEISEALKNITLKIQKLKKKNPFVFGKETFFSNMSDWNPAEMIGDKPTNLSMSLYSELITDTVWATQRKDYGYKNLELFPLMVNLGGSPFIDLRIDFNSFLPASLSKNTSKKLINIYLNKIKNKSELHDKIEFDLIETCYDFDTRKKIKKLLNKKQQSEYSKSLLNLTNNILDPKKDILNREIKKIKLLKKQLIQISKSNLSEIHKIYFLIQYTKKNGTLPFAGLARAAFVSTRLLKTLNEKKLISNQELENLYGSIGSITKKMNKSLSKINNTNDIKRFKEIYGHLRPSSYSIESRNYKENFSKYFSKKNINLESKNIIFSVSNRKKLLINNLLKQNKISLNFEEFINFSKESIKLREYSKYIFSKGIDEIFKNLISLGKKINIKREDFEHVSIKKILNFYNNVESGIKLKTSLKKEIVRNKKNRDLLNLIKFPDFIRSSDEMYFFKQSNIKGNYITTKSIIGKIIELKNLRNINQISNKIVLLKNADPGYDFIFSQKITGLITEYGGANSHMSIRCMELGIPAIIGIGNKEYSFIKNKRLLQINALQKNYKIIE